MAILFVEKPLREKLGEEAVDSLVRLINSALAEQESVPSKPIDKSFEPQRSYEFAKLDAAIDKWKTDVIEWMFIFAVAEIVMVWGVRLVFLER
jgi:hypothetical protein